jgi:hypothetical protein
MKDAPEFIVAEVSKNWKGKFPSGGKVDFQDMLSGRFERVIARNLQRGYRLHSFRLHRLMTEPDCLNETIIAVFQKSKEGEPAMNHKEAVEAVRRGDRAAGPHSLHAVTIPPCPGFNHHWRTLFCDGETDVVECSRCGIQQVAPCNFDEEYA